MKRDINLLPRKKGDTKKTTGILVAVLVATFYVLIFGLGFFIPKNMKDTANALNNGLQNQINELQPEVDKYEELKAELALLRASMETTGALNFSIFDAEKCFDIIEETCPSGVMVQKVSNSDSALTLKVIASTNYQVAQFALLLERTGYFLDVGLSGSEPADLIMDENELQTGSNAVQSTIFLVYNLDYREETDDETVTEEGGTQ